MTRVLFSGSLSVLWRALLSRGASESAGSEQTRSERVHRRHRRTERSAAAVWAIPHWTSGDPRWNTNTISQLNISITGIIHLLSSFLKPRGSPRRWNQRKRPINPGIYLSRCSTSDVFMEISWCLSCSQSARGRRFFRSATEIQSTVWSCVTFFGSGESGEKHTERSLITLRTHINLQTGSCIVISASAVRYWTVFVNARRDSKLKWWFVWHGWTLIVLLF